MGRLKIILRWCASNFRYYVVFQKSTLFILGLIFSYKLVEKLFFNILITYLSPPSDDDYDMQKAAVVVNLQGGICSSLTIILTIVADAYVGFFKMLVSSSILCIAGLVVTHFAAKKYDDNFDDFLNMFYPTLVLLTLSEAATDVTLKSFFGDQLAVVRNQPATAEEEKQTEKRTEFWLYFVSFFASVLVLLGPLSDLSLEGITGVLAIVSGASLFWFSLGFKFYNRVKPAGSAISDVPVVICSAISKRNVAYPESSEQLHQNSGGDVQILPHTSWLRWLDRAAVVQENQEDRSCCSVEQVMGVKYLLQMLPMWSTFITFSIVRASGDTFFLEEAGSITDATFPLLFLITLQRFTELAVSETSDYALEKLHEKLNFNAQHMMLVRIGIGMLCCVLCCITAWTQAVHRMDLVATYGDASDHMSVYRLTPQFLLLAFMEGLSLKGLQNFFESRVSRSMFRYGPSFEDCVDAFGRFGSIACILILGKWLRKRVEKSQLDNYYLLLAFLSGLNTMAYFLVALWYGDDQYVTNYDLQMVIIGGEEQSESSPLLRRVRSFPAPSMTRGAYNRLSSMPC